MLTLHNTYLADYTSTDPLTIERSTINSAWGISRNKKFESGSTNNLKVSVESNLFKINIKYLVVLK